MTIGAWIDRAILKAKQGALPNTAPGETQTPVRVAGPTPDNVPESTPASPIAVQPTVPTEPETPPSEVPVSDPPQTPPQTPMPPAENVQADNVRELVAAPRDRAGINIETVDEQIDAQTAEYDSEARPLAMPPTQRSPLRYAALGLFLLVILAGGGWLFFEFSDTAKKPNAIVAKTGKPPAEALPQKKPQTGLPSPATPASVLPDEVRTGIAMANAGDAKAQHDLGMLHLTGRFVKKDSAEAAKWFERAAVQGLANAQFNLGVLYERGEGLAQNDRLAFFWYQSAAEQGMVRAQHNLATAYAQGRGIAKNYSKAIDWYTKSANAGLAASQYSLAAIYERGLATGKPDLPKARLWYEKAMAQGDTQATERLAALDSRPPGAKSATAVTQPLPPAPAAQTAKPIGRAEIQEIQMLLARMNFDPGPADGQMGQRTAEAIKLYQRFAGIDVDGVPTRDLLEEIRLVAGSMSRDG